MKKVLHIRIVIEEFELKHLDELVNDIETLLTPFGKQRVEVSLRDPVQFRRRPVRE